MYKKYSQGFLILLFLGFFGFSVGLFDNYRELWMSSNGLDTTTVSHIISISYVVTVLVLLYFTIRVPLNSLREGILISLVLKLCTGTILVCLNQSHQLFIIKILLFFDISFSQLILACVYPLLMTIGKSDILYAKKSVVESVSNKLGFLLVSLFLGKSLCNFVIDYNMCLLLSLIFVFLSFVILMNVSLVYSSSVSFNLAETIRYFNKNKIYYFYLFFNLFSNIVWASVMGMPLLTLTKNFGLSSNNASFIILGFGIISNFLSLVIIKYMKFKNDYINLFFKFGVRILFYIGIFFTENKILFLGGFIYLLLTDCTHNFIFTSFFINRISFEYSLFFTILKYCFSLIGSSIGVALCGLVFSLKTSLVILPALIIGIIHYIMAIMLVRQKRKILIHEK